MTRLVSIAVFSVLLAGCVSAPRKPMGGGQAMKADPALEQFLISHGFHREERDIFSRRYISLTAASRDLGFSIGGLVIPPNGPAPGRDVEDTRVCRLDGWGDWGFVVMADKGHTLDDPSTPCTVGTSLIQVH